MAERARVWLQGSSKVLSHSRKKAPKPPVAEEERTSATRERSRAGEATRKARAHPMRRCRRGHPTQNCQRAQWCGLEEHKGDPQPVHHEVRASRAGHARLPVLARTRRPHPSHARPQSVNTGPSAGPPRPPSHRWVFSCVPAREGPQCAISATANAKSEIGTRPQRCRL